MKKIKWRPTACAPKGYPAEVCSGDFIYPDGNGIYIPGGRVMYYGWGNTGPCHIVGEDTKPVPEILDITWISYTEKTFYTGRFELPQKKMTHLFEQGFMNRLGEQATYSELNVGVAPGGVVVVWLLGAGWSTEVGRFQAPETTLTMKEFKPYATISQEQYIDETLGDLPEQIKKEIDSKEIPYGLWDQYRTKYNWYPEFYFTNTGELVHILVEFYNGERFFVEKTNPILYEPQEHPIPRYIRMEWYDKNRYRNGARITFDEKEVFDAFNDIYHSSNLDQAKLIIEVDRYNSNISLFLGNPSEQLQLEKALIEVYLIEE